MKFSQGARRVLRGLQLDPDEVARVLERVEAILPHLNFDSWRVSRSDNRRESGEATWHGADNHEIGVSISALGTRLESNCHREDGAIRREDHRLLEKIALEAAQILPSIKVSTLSLVDFGTRSVAEEMKDRLSLGISPLPILQFIRGLGQETYENQRLSYGLIIEPGENGSAALADAFDNKRFKRLTDGFSTALVVDSRGRIVELTPLTVQPREGLTRMRRPWWAAGIADAARERGGIGIALTRNGDILVVHDGRIVFTQRAGRWCEWDHSAIFGRLRDLWGVRGNPQKLHDVLSHFYHLAMDLAFRRSGGLLVVTESHARVRSLLASTVDLLGSNRRDETERALDRHLQNRIVYRIDRRVIADLASLDGALIVDRTGRIWAYGAMTKVSKSAQQGARTRAAKAASQEGVAIKVSSDGDISFFRKGQLRFQI